VLSNLAQAFPELPPTELARIGARAARSFGRTVTEFIRFGGRDRERVGSLVRLEGNRAASYEVFADGWLQGGRAWGRPVDVQVMPDGSLLVSDDMAGMIYRISWVGV